MQQEEEVATTDPETRRKHFYQIEKSLVVSHFARGSHSVLELVSRKSRNFSGAFKGCPILGHNEIHDTLC